MKKLLLIPVLALGLVGCEWDTKSTVDQPPAPGTPTKEQANALAKQAETQTAAQKRMLELQLDVTKRCVDRGWVPVFINQNVDCKKPQ